MIIHNYRYLDLLSSGGTVFDGGYYTHFCEPYKHTMLISYNLYVSENTFFCLKKNTKCLCPFNFFEKKMSFLHFEHKMFLMGYASLSLIFHVSNPPSLYHSHHEVYQHLTFPSNSIKLNAFRFKIQTL